MKAKLGNTTVEYWQISTTKPENEPWVLDAFEKGQLSWSGQLVMSHVQKEQLISDGMGKTRLADSNKVSKELEGLDWVGLYISPNKLGSAYPEAIYLIVNQVRIPAFGKLLEYLVLAPDGSLEVYSEKKFQRDLTKIK